jgi:hypothetical protein
MRHLLDEWRRGQLLSDDAMEYPKGLLTCLGWQFLPEAT